MVKFDRSLIFLYPLLGLIALLPIAKPSSFDIKSEKGDVYTEFPLNLDGWRGEDTPVDDNTYEILETKNVLSRVYTDPGGERVYLLLVSSKEDRRVAHPPEVCYLSSNFEILDQETYKMEAQDLGKIPVNVFVARPERRPEERQYVLYVYKVGGRYTTNYYSQQLRFALDRFSGGKSQVHLIRLAGRSKEALERFLPKVLEKVTNNS